MMSVSTLGLICIFLLFCQTADNDRINKNLKNYFGDPVPREYHISNIPLYIVMFAAAVALVLDLISHFK